MEDIAPALLEKIRADFQRLVAGDKSLTAILERIDKGAATYAEANAYADRIGIHMSEALRANLSADVLPEGRLWYNIAERIIPDTLLRGQGMIADTAAAVVESLNKQAGVGLKAVKPAADTDRIKGIVNAVSSRETYDRTAEKLLDEPVKLFARNAADEAARENAAFQKKAGLKPKIRRTAGAGCCDWCAEVEGSWDYGDEPSDVYRRHAFCRCEVLFESGKGSYQDVWSKKTYDSREEAAREQRKYIGTRAESDQKRIERQNKLRSVGQSGIAETLSKSPGRLGSFTPESLRQALEKEGYEVKPLSDGSQKGKQYEAGGGYKVNFADGGLLMYHPEEGSHHGGAYYKISTGKGGTKRYELDGTAKPDRKKGSVSK